MRQEGGSVVCGGCNRLVDVDEPTCPHCGQWRPGMFGYAQSIRNVFGDLDVTKMLGTFCIVMYAVSLALDLPFALRNTFAPSDDALLALGMTGGFWIEYDRWFTVLTAIFLHGNIIHILFNVVGIRILGPIVEDSLGAARFLTFFLVTGALAFVVSNVVRGSATVGASGSVFGLLGAHIALGQFHGGSIGQAVSTRAMMWAGFNLVFGAMHPAINNFAHIAGLAAGYGAMQLFYIPRLQRPETARSQAIALLLAVGTILSFLGALFLYYR